MRSSMRSAARARLSRPRLGLDHAPMAQRSVRRQGVRMRLRQERERRASPACAEAPSLAAATVNRNPWTANQATRSNNSRSKGERPKMRAQWTSAGVKSAAGIPSTASWAASAPPVARASSRSRKAADRGDQPLPIEVRRSRPRSRPRSWRHRDLLRDVEHRRGTGAVSSTLSAPWTAPVRSGRQAVRETRRPEDRSARSARFDVSRHRDRGRGSRFARGGLADASAW